MKLSIVIPTMNEARLLPRLLSSIEKQSLNAEVIVADAHSTDETRAIAKRHGAKVVDGGLPSVGRNRGAEAASGEILLFLDADVFFANTDMLQRAVDEFERRSLAIATADIVPDSTKRYDRFAYWVYNRYVRIWGARLVHVPGFFILVRKDLHDRIGGFDEEIVYCEDREYAMRAVQEAPFGFLDSIKIPTSVRRFDRDGRLALTWTYLRTELHFFLKGPVRDDSFDYTFGYDSDSQRKE